MSEFLSNQSIFMKEIISLLREQKNLFVEFEDSLLGNSLGFALCLHIHDQNNNKYSLLINHNNNPNDVHMAKVKSKYLKQLNHPNIIQQIDDFTLGDCYFIQTERIQTCLFDWINSTMHKNPISELDFVEIALQMIGVTQYLNQHKCSLNLLSTLTSFTIDEAMKIKLIHFTTPQPINIAKVKQIFNECKEQNKLFYYKKDILKLNNNCQMWQNFDVDLWAIGICLYYLSGASVSNILSYVLDEDSFRISEFLGFQSNIKLYSMICDTINLYVLPCFQNSLIPEQKHLEHDNSITIQNEQDFKSKYLQVKEDVQIFIDLHQQISDDKTGTSQQEQLKYLIEKYGKIDSLLQLQTKLLSINQNYAEAILCSEEMLKMNPQSDRGYYNLGKICQEQQQFEKSIELFQKCIEIDPLNDNAYFNIGVSYEDLKSSLANEFYQKAADINCNREDSFFNIGVEYDAKAEHQNAILAYKRALKISNIGDADTLNNLACNYNRALKYEKSIHYQKKVIEIEGENPRGVWVKFVKKKI